MQCRFTLGVSIESYHGICTGLDPSLTHLFGCKTQSVIDEHQSTQTKAPKVLLIVADGVRPDALIKAQTPSIDRLRETAVFSHQVSMTYPTISGNGWTTILTGVTSEHHGVINNKPEHFEVYSKTHRMQQFPVLPAIIEANNPDLSTASFVKWPKINYYLNRWSSDAYNISVLGGSIEGKHVFRAASENAITEAAVKFLTTQPSDFVFYGLERLTAPVINMVFAQTFPSIFRLLKILIKR